MLQLAEINRPPIVIPTPAPSSLDSILKEEEFWLALTNGKLALRSEEPQGYLGTLWCHWGPSGVIGDPQQVTKLQKTISSY